jgi:hypothetical protein
MVEQPRSARGIIKYTIAYVGLTMHNVGTRLFLGFFLGSLVVATLGPLALGCSNETLGGSGAGGKTGTGGYFGGGVGGTTGTGASFGGATGTGASTLGFGGTTGDGGIGGDGTGGECQAIMPEPPIFTVFDVSTGAPICDPTFTVLDVSAGGIIPGAMEGAYPCDGMGLYGCPASDGGTAPCQFALEAIGDMPLTSHYTIEVSAPGYSAATAYEVTSGQLGCGINLPASHITLDLTPNPGSVPSDAGPPIDAHPPSDPL